MECGNISFYIDFYLKYYLGKKMQIMWVYPNKMTENLACRIHLTVEKLSCVHWKLKGIQIKLYNP